MKMKKKLFEWPTEQQDRQWPSVIECNLLAYVHNPFGDGIKRGHTGQIKHNDGSHGVFVVDAGHVAEALMASYVPESGE